MQTSHRVLVGDARELESLEEDSVHLVVTSPPYPMIEMWDEVFSSLDPAIEEALDEGDGQAAFEAMHATLDAVWQEVARVLVPGGIAAINVGDATRRIAGSFQLYPNHARVLRAFTELGFQPLPDILWRKPTNSAAKFMGSGMLPPNAYTTLEHEHILLLRNGPEQRSFEPRSDRRYESAYFWEERNAWFTDLWMDLNGAPQAMADPEIRERSAAFPFELPYRLINMYSVRGDVVLDPFWGTGTTSLAAMVAARSSVGVEIEPAFAGIFERRVAQAESTCQEVLAQRLADHRAFVAERQAQGKELGYTSEHYGFPVTTKQETRLRFQAIEEINPTPGGYTVDHAPLVQQAQPVPAGLAEQAG